MTKTNIKQSVARHKKAPASSMLNVDVGTTPAQRQKISTALYTSLSDTYVLMVKFHNYHWNVTGPHFGPLHRLFQTQYEELFIGIDELAERIRTLGFPVDGTMESFKKNSSITEFFKPMTDVQMIQDLVKGHETVIASLRAAAALASSANDIETEDLTIARLREHEKNAWLLISHL